MAQILWTVLVLVIGGALGVCLGPRYRTSTPTAVTAPVIGRITELADLVVLRVPVSKVHVTRIGGYVGGVDCIVLVNGEVEISSDMMLARFEKVDVDARRATLILSRPVVRHARLDHEQTIVYRIDRKGLWIVVPSGEPTRGVINKAMREAQLCVQRVGEDPQLVDRSRRRTEQVLNQVMVSMGWEVNVEWREGDSETETSIVGTPDG